MEFAEIFSEYFIQFLGNDSGMIKDSQSVFR